VREVKRVNNKGRVRPDEGAKGESQWLVSSETITYAIKRFKAAASEEEVSGNGTGWRKMEEGESAKPEAAKASKPSPSVV